MSDLDKQSATPLPSREAIKTMGHSLVTSWERQEQETAILEAYAEGRLVDREAIDREWVYGWIEAAFGEFLVGAKEHDTEHAKLAELQAAFGDTE